MYFSGKSYFNTSLIRDVEVIRRKRSVAKPKPRKKKRLTRKKKAKKKYNLTKLKKELGNDMVIKLLLRLVEGKAPRGRPPTKEKEKAKYDIYGEKVKKPRQMRIRKGSGIPPKRTDPSIAPRKGATETDAQFITRFEDWLYQNNPYFIIGNAEKAQSKLYRLSLT